jgi:hypothetical protein
MQLIQETEPWGAENATASFKKSSIGGIIIIPGVVLPHTWCAGNVTTSFTKPRIGGITITPSVEGMPIINEYQL